SSDQLQTDIRNFNVNTLNSVLPIDISGIINGNIDINKLENDILIESNLRGSSFYIEDFLVGDIDCLSDWENDRDRLFMELTVNRTGKRIIDINGYLYPRNDQNQLQMTADFDSANLNIIQPFIVKNFTNLSGLATGNFDITGNISSPILNNSRNQNGEIIEGKITNGNITINYTNTSYSFSGGINFEENQIGVKNLKLIDRQNNTASFNGGIFHDGFRNFVLDISGEYNNFQMLNTGPKDNKLYYGTAYATGDLSILGGINNLTVSAHAKTARGTKISIPIGEISEYNIEQKDYISFVNLSLPENTKRLTEVVKEEIDLKGLKLDFDIEVTNDAYTELIFDVRAGDIIRGRGNGNIELLINPDGDFNMFGDLQIESGGYNFTLYNIINKEFDIQKGSSISWYGDPYGAKLNITAQYRQLASLTPILNIDNSTSASPELRKKYPSIVDLFLKGNLLSPEISFDINIEDYPNNITVEGGSIPLDTQISAFKTRLLANEQELKRQVFSLVILRKFSPENSFSVNSQTIGNSLSEFVSNQLSYWATQVDENLEVDVNLAGLNQDAFNTFQLRLSYSFLDGRLKVTRGGNLYDNNNKADISSIIGDWTVEYLLTQDGRLRAKMYSRSNLSSSINRSLGENNTETGFSLQYVRSFDELKHILTESRKENQTNDSAENASKIEGVLIEEDDLIILNK
ncbi:MAG: translocation/assembly module TamB, partial [Cyclobacteriaceae bacterium]|nr:translocation/assembly module TamB [Cyclobacteriaceae bacterium]